MSSVLARASLARKYATALFNSVKSSSEKQDKVFDSLSSLRALVDSSTDLQLVLNSPAIKTKQKVLVLNDIAGSLDAKTGSELTNFFSLLGENRRLNILVSSVDAYEELYRKAKGQTMCVVTSAENLSAKERDDVIAAIAKRTGKQASTLHVQFKVNSGLLGGLVVSVGDSTMDFSANARIEKLRTALNAPLNTTG